MQLKHSEVFRQCDLSGSVACLCQCRWCLDNAKKTIEDEPESCGNTARLERHKAGVVGDTVGDPLKDTAGPALNPMIKVVNLVSLIAAPVIVRYQKLGVVGWLIVAVLLVSVIWAITNSKRKAEFS